MNFKNLFVFILIITFSSCKEKDTCYPEFKESLAYLKEFVKHDPNITYYFVDVDYNVEVMESISGIMNSDGGNPIGTIVLQSDVDKWEKWITEKCSMENKSD